MPICITTEATPANAYLHYNRGNAYVRCIEFQHAIEDYTRAIQLDPNLAEAYYNRGLARLALKQQNEAKVVMYGITE